MHSITRQDRNVRRRIQFRSNRRPPAFTLVELLVSIAVLAVLFSLLLPAVQQARESARRTQCRNNLKQIALAFQHHHDVVRAFPTGGYDWWEPPTFSGSTPNVGETQRAGWGYQVLPFLEAENTWRGGDGPTDIDRMLIAVGTPNATFFCPSRRGLTVLTYSDPSYLGGISVAHAMCDYAGANLELTGAVRRYKPIKISQIVDGTSQTLIVGEKRMNRKYLNDWQEDDNEGYTAGWDEDTMRRTEKPPAPDHFDEGDGGELFGSAHANGFNVALADGSVHTVNYLIDASLFKSLGDISDGKSVSIEQAE